MEKFAQRLKHCREQKKLSNPNWTQKYVADKIGMARTTYTAYENGTKLPPLDIVDSLATLLEVSTDYLLGRTDIKDHNTINANSEFEAWVNDPRSKILFKEFNESSEEQKEAMLKMWEILKSQGKL